MATNQQKRDDETVTQFAVRRIIEDETARKDAEIERLRAALTPSGDTKAAYIGEFSFTYPDFDEDGEEVTRRISVPWTTIKEIMAAIRQYADASPEREEKS